MSLSAWYLAIAFVSSALTGAALWPPRRPQWVVVLTFVPALLVTELAPIYFVGQVAASAGFIAAGAFNGWLGWIGSGLMLVSGIGLGAAIVSARRTGRVFADALADGLGPDWAADLQPIRQAESKAFKWSRVAQPLRFRRCGVERVRDIPYVDGDTTRRHRLDVYHRPNVGPGAPVLLQIHGGAWIMGHKGQQALPLLYHLAARGWVCVATNYRLSPAGTWPDHLVDCKRAMAWIRAHIAPYGGDPSYVVVTGGSAGGHLAALMGLTANDPRFQPGFEDVDTRVRAMVLFYGVYDWTNRFGFRGRRDAMCTSLLEPIVVKKKFVDARDVFERASPMSHLCEEAPAALVVHGDLDTLAPIAEARQFVKMLRAVSRNPVAYAELKGAHHAFELLQSIRSLQTVEAVDDFLMWLLASNPPAAVAALDHLSAPR